MRFRYHTNHKSMVSDKRINIRSTRIGIILLILLTAIACLAFLFNHFALRRDTLLSAKPSGWTPLHQAALIGDEAQTTLLLKDEAKIDATASGDPTDEFWQKEHRQLTPLAIAIAHNNSTVAETLIKSGANVSLAESVGVPLQVAVQQGNLSFARFLITHGSDVNRRDPYGNTALHDAKTEQVAAFLIQNGAHAAQTNTEGETPLHTAATVEIANLLLKHGAPINKQDKLGRTALIDAVNASRFDVAKMLVSYGADVNLGVASDHWSALQWAVKNNDADLVHRLLNQNALVNPQSVDTPLLLAASNGIIDSGDNDGLGVSADRGPTTIARLLIEHGADINARNKDGQTPLIEASLMGDNVMVPLLLKHGSDINAVDASGYTSLHWAAWNWQPRVVRILVNHGASLNVKNKDGKTALDLARAALRVGPVHKDKPNPIDILSKASQTVK